MNKPTKEEMRDALLEAIDTIKAWHGPDAWEIYRDQSPEMKRITRAFNAIRALISASPEAGEQREDGYIEHLKAEQKRAIEDCAVPEKFLKPAPDPHSLEMLKETGIYFAPPAPLAPQPAEVEAAMVTLRECADYCRVSQRSCAAGGRSNDALATIRAALTEARQPKVVSREQVRKWIPCTCIDDYKDRGLEDPTCPFHSTAIGWWDLLEELGYTVGKASEAEEPK